MKTNLYKIVAAVIICFGFNITVSFAQTFTIVNAELSKPTTSADTTLKLSMKVSDPDAVFIISIDYFTVNNEYSGQTDSYFAETNGDKKLMVANGKEIVPFLSDGLSLMISKKYPSGKVNIQVFDKNYKNLAKTELTY